MQMYYTHINVRVRARLLTDCARVRAHIPHPHACNSSSVGPSPATLPILHCAVLSPWGRTDEC